MQLLEKYELRLRNPRDLLRLQKWIGSALVADCRAGTVTWNHPGFIWEIEQAILNRIDDLFEVAAGQIGAADTSGEERVPGDHHFERSEVQAN